MHFSPQQPPNHSSDQESEHLVTGGAALPNHSVNHVWSGDSPVKSPLAPAMPLSRSSMLLQWAVFIN